MVLSYYQNKGREHVNRLEMVISTLDYLLISKRKRHISGGILISTSLLFAGLAFTVLTLKAEEKNDEQFIE